MSLPSFAKCVGCREVFIAQDSNEVLCPACVETCKRRAELEAAREIAGWQAETPEGYK